MSVTFVNKLDEGLVTDRSLFVTETHQFGEEFTYMIFEDQKDKSTGFIFEDFVVDMRNMYVSRRIRPSYVAKWHGKLASQCDGLTEYLISIVKRFDSYRTFINDNTKEFFAQNPALAKNAGDR